MKMFARLVLGTTLLGLGLSFTACNKPSEDDCRKAIQRIRELTGTSKIDQSADVETAVRSCRGNATKSSVQCAMTAGRFLIMPL